MGVCFGGGRAAGMAITDWEIEKTALVCAASRREFAEGEEIHSALYEEGGTFVRRDYSVERWPPADVESVFCFWKTQAPKRCAPVRRFVDDEVIMDFFRRLEGREEAQRRNFRYVLALLLMRKKALKFREMRRDGEEMVMILHDRVSDCDYEVIDPRLTAEQVEDVSGEVGRVLNTRI